MNNNAQFADFSSNSVNLADVQTVNPVSPRRGIGRSQHVVWGAFQAGMQALQYYAGRSPANPESIAKANLQLLHHSLLEDPSYTQSLKMAHSKNGNNLPSSNCIFENNGLRADLFTLKPGNTIQLKSHQGRYAMYLSITGKPSVQSPNNVVALKKYWWGRYRQEQPRKLLKNGDAVVAATSGGIKRSLTAEKKECILLRVELPSR